MMPDISALAQLAGPPDQIDVTPGGGQDQGPSDEELLQQVLDILQQVISNSDDTADSAAISDIHSKLAKLVAGNQDAHIQAMGGNPKQHRAMRKAYGRGQGPGSSAGVGGGDGSTPVSGPAGGGGGPGTDGGGGQGVGIG